MLLKEGGNIFKGSQGELLTGRINQADVAPTVKWLEGITGLSLSDTMLGSTGKAASSGDLDLGVDESKISKDQLVTKLSQWTQSQQQDPKQWVRKSGISVHFKTPIQGDSKKGFVQTDFMFGDPEWQKFSLQGGLTGSEYKGMDRHILLASIAKALGYRWSHNYGLLNRESNQPVSKDPDRIAQLLLGVDHTAKDLNSVESINKIIRGRSDYEKLVADAVESFAKARKKLPEHTVEGSNVWFRNMMNVVGR
jgi:hypothetical protein